MHVQRSSDEYVQELNSHKAVEQRLSHFSTELNSFMYFPMATS